MSTPNSVFCQLPGVTAVFYAFMHMSNSSHCDYEKVEHYTHFINGSNTVDRWDQLCEMLHVAIYFIKLNTCPVTAISNLG